MRPWILSETTYAYTKENPYDTAVLPLGATEPHNLHLPYGTDHFEATIIGETICEAAHRDGARVVLLPTIPYGTETNMRELPLALNLDPTTLFQVVTDLVESVTQSGIRKILLLNAHGGNEMKPLLRELAGKTTAQLFLCNFFHAMRGAYDTIFDCPEDHAGEMETSFMLAFRPDLVNHNEDGTLAADDGAVASTRFAAINEGWVSITRPWHLLTTNTGSGNPHAATAEKGRQMMDVLVQRVGHFLVELSHSQLDDQFPF